MNKYLKYTGNAAPPRYSQERMFLRLSWGTTFFLRISLFLKMQLRFHITITIATRHPQIASYISMLHNTQLHTCAHMHRTCELQALSLFTDQCKRLSTVWYPNYCTQDVGLHHNLTTATQRWAFARLASPTHANANANSNMTLRCSVPMLGNDWVDRRLDYLDA